MIKHVIYGHTSFSTSSDIRVCPINSIWSIGDPLDFNLTDYWEVFSNLLTFTFTKMHKLVKIVFQNCFFHKNIIDSDVDS